MDPLPIILKISAVWLLFVVSPGPNFLVVTQHSMSRSRRMGLFAALGVSVGAAFWAVAALAGIRFVIVQFALAYGILKMVGAAYLIYVGGCLMFRSGLPAYRQNLSKKMNGSGIRAVRLGLLTSLSNPKTASFFGSLFIVTLPEVISAGMTFGLISVIFGVSIVWYTLVACLFSLNVLHRWYMRAKSAIDFLMGGMLVCLGVRLAWKE